MKKFLLGALRIAIGVVGAIILLAVIGLAIGGGWYAHIASKNAPLAETRSWPEIRIAALQDTRLRLVTMWRDGALHYQFSVTGYPKAVAEARARPRAERTYLTNSPPEPGFTLQFTDQHGFRVFDHHVALGAMAKRVDAAGAGTGLDAKGDISLDADSYRQAALWSATWNFSVGP